MRSVARPRNVPMLATSVAVVRKMLEAVAGSAPNLFKTNGISAPKTPLMRQLHVIAMSTMIESVSAAA